MFEELIISERNNIKFLMDGLDYIQFSEIINKEDYPQYFRQYLNGYLLEHFTKLKLDLNENYSINLNDLELSDQWRSFEIACRDFFRLHKEKIDKIILESVQLNLNLTLRPNQTLVNFLFRDELYQIPENIKIRMHYFDSDIEIISKIKIWLEEQTSIISIFQFRKIANSIISELFKQNEYSKVSAWFQYLIESLASVKFTSEYSTFTILGIFSRDLNWNGLQQFLSVNKTQYFDQILSKSSIENALSFYLATWLKDSKQTEENEQTTSANKTAVTDADLEEFEHGKETAEETIPAMDEHDKMMIEESYEGEEESYGATPEQNPDEEEEELSESILEQITENSEKSDVEVINEDLSKVDEILAELNQAEQISVEQSNQETEVNSEEDEFERMAAMIAGGNDIVNVELHNQPEQDKVQSNIESFEEINKLIQNLDDKLTNKLKTVEDIKDYQELAKTTRLTDLNYIDLDSPQFTQTQTELFKLLIELKKRKAYIQEK